MLLSMSDALDLQPVLNVFYGDRLCQVLDPFGNLLGLRKVAEVSRC